MDDESGGGEIKSNGKRSRISSFPTAAHHDTLFLLETIAQYDDRPSSPLFVSRSDCIDRSDGTDRYALWLQSLGFQESMVDNVWGFMYPREHVCHHLTLT